MEPSDIAIEAQGVSKLFDGNEALDEISFKVKKGEVFGFLGPNGAGKSTFIRVVLNFIKPSSGSVSIFGLDSVKDSVEVKSKLGYLAGDISLYGQMTGAKLLKYFSTLGGVTNWKLVDEMVDKLGATLDKRISSLSKGNKQKIGIILALMKDPKLLILDEPTSGLDPLMKQVFYDLISDAKKDGRTIFLSSHDLLEVQKVCDRAAFIRNGRLISIEDVNRANNLNLKRYEITFPKTPRSAPFAKIKGVGDLSKFDKTISLAIQGCVTKVLEEAVRQGAINLTEKEVSLEDMFMHYYQDRDQT